MYIFVVRLNDLESALKCTGSKRLFRRNIIIIYKKGKRNCWLKISCKYLLYYLFYIELHYFNIYVFFYFNIFHQVFKMIKRIT